MSDTSSNSSSSNNLLLRGMSQNLPVSPSRQPAPLFLPTFPRNPGSASPSSVLTIIPDTIDAKPPSSSSSSSSESAASSKKEKKLAKIETNKKKYGKIFDFIKSKDAEKLALFIDENPKLPKIVHELVDEDKSNPLAVAIQTNNKNIAALLINIDSNMYSLTNGLLLSITQDAYELIVMILDKQNQIKEEKGIIIKEDSHPPCRAKEGLWTGTCDDYPPYMTPLMVACEKNSFPSVKILLQYGHRLHIPHPPTCRCEFCETLGEVSLVEAKARYFEFRALTCPAYIILSYLDPLLYSFRLNSVLKDESKSEPEFFDEYISLANQCAEFATNLLNQCRTKEEVMILLSRQAEFRTRASPMPFNRVHQALELDFYTFVTHVNCQQVLSDEWYGNDSAQRRYGSGRLFLTYIIRVLILPFMAAIYLVAPFSPLADRCRIPANKFVNEAASFTLFLIVNLIGNLLSEYHKTRGPPPWLFTYYNIIHIFAIWYSKIKYLWKRGNHSFLQNAWNLFDAIMLTFFTLGFICWGLAAYEIGVDPDSENIPREYWPAFEPKLVGEILYSLGFMLGFFRMFSFLQLSRVIGPLQLCVFRMIVETLPFLCIMGIVWLAFTVVLYNLYHSYAKNTATLPDGSVEKASQAYVSLVSAASSVYWAFFGDSESLAPKVVLPAINMKVGNKMATVYHKHALTQAIGSILFAIFHLLGIVILMNMLVAIMSDSYSNIVGQSLIKWKFARTRIWLSYFYEGNTLPAPYNIIPSLKIFVKAYLSVTNGNKEAVFNFKKRNDLIGNDDIIYKKLMDELVNRYMKSHQADFLKKVDEEKRESVRKKRKEHKEKEHKPT